MTYLDGVNRKDIGKEMFPENVEPLEAIGTKKGKITGQTGTCCPDF